MRLDPETRHRSILPLLAVVMAGVYLFGFVPIDRKAASLDAPLEQCWRQLAAALGQTNALALDFVSITNQLQVTRTALAAFETARQQARSRVEPDAALQAQLGEPFLLVDYLYEAGRRMDALARLAKQEGVGLEPAVFAGFPEQSSDMREPALLWAELAFLDGMLTTAINAKVTTIHSVAAPMPLLPPANGSGSTHGRLLTELPLQIELTGPMANIAQFLQTLPLRTDEIKGAGLPAAPPNKPALFIDRLVLRKQSPDKLDEVRLTLRATGFVFPK
jgi:hypothetical protein